MLTRTLTQRHAKCAHFALALLLAVAVTVTGLPHVGQAQYVDSQRRALAQADPGLVPMAQGLKGGSVAIVQGLKGGSVAIVQTRSAEFVIPQAVFERIDAAGTVLSLHTVEGNLLDEIVTEQAVTELPTADLDIGTYILTAVSNMFSETYLLHIQ